MSSIAILAAGLGKRMGNPNIPKVLSELHNKPLIYYVVTTALKLNPKKIVLIVGHQRELLINYIKNTFPSENIEFAIQEEQLGTGHAIKCTESIFENFNDDILILSGDVPLLREQTLHGFMNFYSSKNADIAVLSALASNPQGYGRIVRDANNDFISIVEEKDANEQVKKNNEINSGIYYLSSKLLFDLLGKVNNNNSQNEYYLTDIIAIAKTLGKNVVAHVGATFEEIQGINNPEQLQDVAQALKSIN